MQAVRFLLGLNLFSCKLLACLQCSCALNCVILFVCFPIYTSVCVLLQACIAAVSLGSLSTETFLVNYAVVKDGHAIVLNTTIINDVLLPRAACTVASGAHQCHNCAMQPITSANTETYTKWFLRPRKSSASVSSQYWYFMTDSVSITDSNCLIIIDTTESVLNASCQ